MDRHHVFLMALQCCDINAHWSMGVLPISDRSFMSSNQLLVSSRYTGIGAVKDIEIPFHYLPRKVILETPDFACLIYLMLLLLES